MKIPEQVTAFWRARQPRERRFLAGLAVFLAAALLGQLLWTAHGERQRLRIQLLRQASELEALRAGAEEWRRLVALPEWQGVAPGEEARKSIAQGAKALGLAAVWRDASSLQVNGQVEFDSWVKWLGEVQQDHHLRVLRAKGQAAGPGRVLVEAELSLPGERNTP